MNSQALDFHSEMSKALAEAERVCDNFLRSHKGVNFKIIVPLYLMREAEI